MVHSLNEILKIYAEERRISGWASERALPAARSMAGERYQREDMVDCKVSFSPHRVRITPISYCMEFGYADMGSCIFEMDPEVFLDDDRLNAFITDNIAARRALREKAVRSERESIEKAELEELERLKAKYPS